MNWFFLAFSSAIFSAIAAILQKKTLFKIDALDFSFLLSLTNLILSIPIFIFFPFSPSIIALVALYVKSILGAFAFLNVMNAIKKMEISGALPLMVLTPGLVAIFAFILLDESLILIEIVGMLLLLSGTYLLEIKTKNDLLSPFKIFWESKNHRYIIFALLLFTLTSLLDKFILNQYKLPPIHFVAYQHLFLAFNFLIIVFIKRSNPIKIIRLQNFAFIKWIILISIITITYRFTQLEAIKLAPVALVLSVKRFSVFFAAIIGGKIFNEKNLLRKSIATIILIIGAILIINN